MFLKQGDILVIIKYKFGVNNFSKREMLAFGFIPGISFKIM